MIISLMYITAWLLCLVVMMACDTPLPDEMIQQFNEVFSTTRVLIAAGIIGICNRLDDIHKQLNKNKEGN